MAPDRYESRRHGVWGHWVPLAVTLTVATAGVVVWAWKQRKDSDDDGDDPGLVYDNNNNNGYAGRMDDDDDDDDNYTRPPDGGYHPAPSVGNESVVGGSAPPPAPLSDVSGWGARMSGALRRTPSPQHFLDTTGKTVAAGFAAAGAAVGKALSSIREDDRQYPDGNPWSEEADAKADRAPLTSPRNRKTVAVVVSADSLAASSSQDATGYFEHASILSHIPRHNDFSKIKLFVLIYTPEQKDAAATALDASTSNLPPPSMGSSYSNLGNEQIQSPTEEAKQSAPNPPASNPAFEAVYSQALAIVDKEAMVLPFTTPNGHVHILRHLQPEVIYLQESMAGDNGSIITNLQTWLRHDVVLIVGAEGGAGGLADSESEAEKPTTEKPSEEKWWQRPERVGRGRGIVVVDSMRVHDDWARRVQGAE